MFKPAYRITPFLISCLESIATQKVSVEQVGTKSPVRINVARDTFNRSVHSSTWIEGNMLSLAQVAALSADKDIVAQENQKCEVRNCIKVLRWILKNKNSILNHENLLKLHAMMTKGLLPEERSGRYRGIQNYIVNAKQKVIFTPRPPAKVKPGMSDLFLWLKQHDTEHPIVRSAIFHHEFVGIHPFVDGNGRVARAASQWLLLRDGYDSTWTLGLDEFFAQDQAKYYDMIQQTHDMDSDYTCWIEYIAQGLLESIQTVARRLKEGNRGGKPIALTPKQKELLELLAKEGVIGSAEICKQMKINRARVNQLIAPLVKAGVVIMEGTTRAVKYRIA